MQTNKIIKVNKNLISSLITPFLLLLILANIIKTDIIIKKGDLPTVEDDNYMETENKLDFTEGKWVMADDVEDNPDDRIFEFHPDFEGFINYRMENNIVLQSYLRSPDRVIVFYKDKNPVIRSSIVEFAEDLESQKEDVETLVLGEYNSDDSILNKLNLFPYTDAFGINNVWTNELFNYNEKLRKFIDKDDPKELKSQYRIPETDETVMDFWKKIVVFAFDFMSVKNLDMMKSSDYATDFDIENAVDGEKKTIFLNERLQTLLDDQSVQMTFKTFHMAMQYYIIKCMREFFYYDPTFIQYLYNEFTPGETLIPDLFQNLQTNPEAREKIFYLREMENFNFDFPFDRKQYKIETEEQLKDPDVLGDYIIQNKKYFGMHFNNLVQKIYKKNTDLFESDEFPKFKMQSSADLTAFWELAKQGMLDKYLGKFTQYVEEGFKEIDMIQDNLKKAESPEQQAKILRQRFMSIGYLEFNDEIDRPNMSWEEISIFENKDRLVLI